MKTFKNATEQKFARLVEELESKFITGTWVMPFKAARPHFNIFSNKRYNGVNAWLLSMIAVEKGYKSNGWLTFKQGLKNDWFVKKGESGVPVQFWSQLKDKENPDKKEVWFVKYFTVFNLEQFVDADGNPIVDTSVEFDADVPNFDEQLLLLERLSAGLNVTIHHKKDLDTAFYRPSEHAIYLPTIPEFHSMKAYLSTVLHELGHSSHRFVRPNFKKDVFGSMLYAQEECIAELISVFVSSMLGIEKIALESHAAYIGGWLQKAKEEDKDFFKKAIKEASKASFYMWDILYPELDSQSSDSKIPEKIEA